MAFFVRSIDHIAEVEEESWIQPPSPSAIVGCHLLTDLFGFMGIALAAIAESVKANLSDVRDLLNALRAYHVGEVDASFVLDRRDRSEKLLAPVCQPVSARAGQSLCGSGGHQRWVRKSRGGVLGCHGLLL
jgi:hypothetical protein